MAAEIVFVKSEVELDQALQIRKEVFVEEQKVPLELEIDEHDIINENVHHVLIQEGNQYVATGRMIYYDDDTAKLQRIAVRKEYRKGGYGRILILALENHARELGMHYSLLDAQCQAEPFYAKLGYVVISDEPFDDAGIPHVRMKKQL